MVARSFILVAIAAAQLPCHALAQAGGFIGISGGASHISSDRYGVRADDRGSFGAKAGYGGSRVKIVLDYQRHGLGDDDQPLPSDWPLEAPEPVRVPQLLETDFLLLGAQIRLTRGLYVRPALGLGWHTDIGYFTITGVGIDSAAVSKEGGLAAGVSLGYNLKLHHRFSLAIEASALLTATVEGEEGTKAIGIQVSPLLDF